MRYEGVVYRPWPEANSELIQVTLGCSNNRCTFCNMFKTKKFRKRCIEDVFKDIGDLRSFKPHVESIFLIDGNVMVLGTSYLLDIVLQIRSNFPECKNIAMYSELNDLRRKSVEDLLKLKEAGVTMIYAGLESGDPEVLKKIEKRMTPQQVIEGMEKAKAAGINVLLSFIFGLGGRYRSKEHIVETTQLLNVTKPEEIAPMALALQPDTELQKEVQNGEFVLATPLQILEEEKYLLENLDSFETYYWGDHGNNIVPQKGLLPKNRETFLKEVSEAINSHPIVKQDVHQTFSW